jgi:glycerol transport system substrate-binding protein
MDYAKVDPSLGWRFTDAWLAMAGVGDPGLPNGQPVDEWGIRVENCHPVGSSVSRGGALNSPAAVYALRKYLEWLRQYAPPDAMKMDFSTAGPVPGRGDIAQQVFWYTAFTADLLKYHLQVNRLGSEFCPKSFFLAKTKNPRCRYQRAFCRTSASSRLNASSAALWAATSPS